VQSIDQINFQSFQLSIRATGQKTQGRKLNPTEMNRYMEQLIESSYMSDKRFLNLAGVNFRQSTVNCNFNNGGFVNSLLRLIQKKFPEVETISFGKNNIKTLAGFQSMGLTLENVKNLSFEENQISDIKVCCHLPNAALSAPSD
jgi:hypothetical protein